MSAIYDEGVEQYQYVAAMRMRWQEEARTRTAPYIVTEGKWRTLRTFVVSELRDRGWTQSMLTHHLGDAIFLPGLVPERLRYVSAVTNKTTKRLYASYPEGVVLEAEIKPEVASKLESRKTSGR